MALTPDFSASQPSNDGAVITLADTSTGSDGAIASRRVYVQCADGTYLVEEGTTTDYEVWDYADASISLDLLDKDYAVAITVQWLNSGGTVLYTKEYSALGFTLFNQSFLYGLTQLLSGNPLLINDNRFFELKAKMRELVDSGDQALELASDLYGAQQCYDRATDMRLDARYLFNANA